MKKTLLTYLLLLFTRTVFSQTPEITSWILNTTGATGYGNILSNVQVVQYSTNNVYVSCTCIPGYDVGPWPGNPNIPSNQNFVYKITRTPVQNTGTPIATALGHTGVWSNGVSIFNAKDAMSYNNQNVWHQNAIVFEGSSFDDCLGHPAPNGEYHHHLNPTCLYDDHDSSAHSPIIGYAFDGFPVYGAYGYVNANGTGGITRMKSSYRIRNISVRTTLPDGTVLNASQYGPAVSATYPLGSYVEDFEYVNGSGDLDEHNGRFCVTPEYPAGIYSYFVTLDSTLTGCYPYTPGPTYYGTVPAGNTGPGSGHNTISEPTTIYSPTTGMEETERLINFDFFPNPVNDYAMIYFDPLSINNIEATLCDISGRVLKRFENFQPSVTYTIDFTHLPQGTYLLLLQTDKTRQALRVVKTGQ